MEVFRKSVAAGLLIGLAGGLFTGMFQSAKMVAAFLFAFALFFICLLGLDLFTGKIGWFGKDDRPVWYYLAVLSGNVMGTLLSAVLLLSADPGLKASARILIDAKMALSWPQLLIKGILCGIMMYLAIACFKKAEGAARWLGIFLGIPVFILCGFEHSIADAAYMFLAMRLDFILPFLIVAAGNALGSIGACFLMDAPWQPYSSSIRTTDVSRSLKVENSKTVYPDEILTERSEIQ